MKRGGSGCRHFLVDSADVVALLSDGEPDPKLRAPSTTTSPAFCDRLPASYPISPASPKCSTIPTNLPRFRASSASARPSPRTV